MADWLKKLRNVELERVGRVSTFRKMAMGTWDDPRDPQIYGTLTVRMEESLRYIDAYRHATGRRLTITHLVAKAIGQALREVPEANAIVRRSRPQQRSKVSVFLSIALEDEATGKIDLTGAKIDEVDRKALATVLDEVERAVDKARSGRDEELEKSRGMMAKIPFGAMRGVLDAIALGLYELNLNLTALGLPEDPFASAIVTNIGSLGLSEAYAPLMAYSKTPILLAVGKVEEQPVVDDGALAVGQVMRIHATLDHRLIDGKHAAMLSRAMKRVLEHPFAELDSIEALEPVAEARA